jgi:uncharacterized protein (DUF934 family)
MPEAAAVPVHALIRLVDGAPRVVEDAFALLEDGAPWDGRGGQLLPLKLALARAGELAGARPVGIWLAPSDEPADAVELFDRIDVIGVRFPAFTDGRGYSTAALLRSRHGWRGELRAVGEVLQDQLFYLRRVGFDSFALRADRDARKALAAFSTFSDSYQASVSPDSPHFRRSEALQR